MNKKTLKGFDFKDKKVLVRTGFDIPLDSDGNILDDTRIQVSIPTIEYLVENGAKQIILTWHMGRPKGKIVENLKTNKVSEYLSKRLNKEIKKVDNWGENGLPNDKIIALENLRFNPKEKSKVKEERDEFGKELANNADIFVNDAFSNCHRNHASMTSAPKYLPSCIGFSVEKELNTWNAVRANPERPLVIIFGGVKADKIDAMANLTDFADKILVGGALAYLMLKCKGMNIGKSKIDTEGLKKCNAEIKNLVDSKKTILPYDCITADEFSNEAKKETVDIENIGNGMALDIGPKTIDKYTRHLNEAKTILWFGPIGVFEFKNFAEGTKKIAQVVANTNGTKIIGGGNSSDAIRDLGLEDKMTLVSTGGGASLELIQGNKLPAIEVINDK